MKTSDLLVTEIQHFCMHDGPGVRTVVFLKGCPLHCAWCHNPETQSPKREIMFVPQKCIGCGACEAVCPGHCHSMVPQRRFDRSCCTACGKCAEACPAAALTVVGEWMSPADILAAVKRDAAFYGPDGGLTVSGGEPTLQAEGLLELVSEAKKQGISVCLETCGVCSRELLRKLSPYVDLFLYDIKDTDEARLQKNTGADHVRVTENLTLLDRLGKASVLRCIMIPGVNMNEGHIQSLAELYHGLAHCEYAELLPYHPYGTSKAEQIGAADQPMYTIPSRESVMSLAEKLRDLGVPVKCFGSLMRG